MEATWMSASRDPRQFDPYRTPDWHWRRATELLAAGRRPLHWEDPAIQRARTYQRDIAIQADYKGICKRLPDLAAAHTLYRLGGISRDEVEARLLAGESPAVIAAKAFVSVEAVVAYEGYFFNVAHCLNAHDWLMTQAVFPSPGGRAVEERHVWCYWALAGGPAMVDLLVTDYIRGNRPSTATPHATTNSSPEAEKARYLVREFCADPSSPKAMAALLKEGCRLFKVYSKAFRQGCKRNGVAYEALRLNLSFLRTAYGVRSGARPPRKRQSRSQVLAKAAASVMAKTEMALEKVAGTSTATEPGKSQATPKPATPAEAAKDEINHASGATPAQSPQLAEERQGASQPPAFLSGMSSLAVIQRLADELRRSAAMEASQTTADDTKGKTANANVAIPGDAPSNGMATENVFVSAAAAFNDNERPHLLPKRAAGRLPARASPNAKAARGSGDVVCGVSNRRQRRQRGHASADRRTRVSENACHEAGR